jgi:uncharacterized SAM-binding protein YcdF (DUF218 family)
MLPRNPDSETSSGLDQQTCPPVRGDDGLDSAQRQRVLAGILIRRESWQLSVRGKILVLIALVGALFAGHYVIYPWLAVTNRVPGEYLIVEGWIHNSGFEQAIQEFKKDGYRMILTSGCRVADTSDFDGNANYADWGAEKVERLGLSKDLVQPVPCWDDHVDRTYHSALAIKDWFRGHHITVTGIDVVTMGPHARRTRLLFQKAFGSKVAVGVIAMPDTMYDSRHWWRSSEGVRDVMGEAIAYVYARFLFYPANSN